MGELVLIVKGDSAQNGKEEYLLMNDKKRGDRKLFAQDGQ